jgi:glutathione peroxidase-family protein
VVSGTCSYVGIAAPVGTEVGDKAAMLKLQDRRVDHGKMKKSVLIVEMTATMGCIRSQYSRNEVFYLNLDASGLAVAL